jgi:hypothetical protein
MFLMLFNDSVSSLRAYRLYSFEWQNGYEWWTGKDKEGSCHDLLKAQPQRFSGVTEEDHKPQSK